MGTDEMSEIYLERAALATLNIQVFFGRQLFDIFANCSWEPT